MSKFKIGDKVKYVSEHAEVMKGEIVSAEDSDGGVWLSLFSSGNQFFNTRYKPVKYLTFCEIEDLI